MKWLLEKNYYYDISTNYISFYVLVLVSKNNLIIFKTYSILSIFSYYVSMQKNFNIFDETL